MKKREKIIVLVGDSRMNDLLQAADIFDKSRFLVTSKQVVSFSTTTGFKPKKVLMAVVESSEKLGTRVAAAYYTTRKGLWKNPDCKVISTGDKLMMLDDYLRSEGVKI